MRKLLDAASAAAALAVIGLFVGCAFQLVAYPVDDPEQPDLVAEFAALRVIRREGRKLTPAEPSARLRLREKSNLLWVVYGSIVQAADGTLVIESLSIGPAFEGQLSRKDDDIACGVTSQLLRLLSPPRLLAETVERLLQQRHQLEKLAHQGARPMPDRQRAVYNKIASGRRTPAPSAASQIEAIARYYLQLCELGSRHPLPALAREFGITRTQARDRIHKARELGYLKHGKQGRIHPEPGPRLT